jgi:hypothetical protein
LIHDREEYGTGTYVANELTDDRGQQAHYRHDDIRIITA